MQILTRENRIVGGCLAMLCAVAWWWLWHNAGAMNAAGAMRGMTGMTGMAPASAAGAPWRLAYFVPAFLMWAIMMVAMMLPSAAPMILLHATFARRSPTAARGATVAFLCAYLLLWVLFSALAAVGQALLVGHGLLARASLTLGDRALVAGLLIATASYQLSGLKRLCLSHCRSPAAFLMRFWRPGIAGAVRMGITHGLYCIGCCGVLMLLLFVGGVMNLAWVALLTLIVLVEKYADPRWRLDRLIAITLLVAAGVLFLR